MLARRPANWRVPNDDPRGVVWKWCELGFACPESVHLPLLFLRWVEDRSVDIQSSQRSNKTVGGKQSERYPNIRVVLNGCVDVNECKEDREGDDMLYNKNLIAPPTNRCHGAEHYPDQSAPCRKASPDNVVILELVANVVVWSPRTEEVAHVHGRSEEHTPRAPSMQPIQALIADTTEKANDVVLSGEQDDEW
jgi:hypothetical protein